MAKRKRKQREYGFLRVTVVRTRIYRKKRIMVLTLRADDGTEFKERVRI